MLSLFESAFVILIFFVIIITNIAAFSASFNFKLGTYRSQSFLLAGVAVVAYLSRGRDAYILAVVAAAPLLRAFIIRPFMALTTAEPLSKPDILEGRSSIFADFFAKTEAHDYWPEYGTPRLGSIGTLVISGLFSIFSYWVAQRTIPNASLIEIVGLGTSLAMLLIGMVVMMNEKDMPSHIMGLLIMENGLFLVAVTFLTEGILIVFSMFVALLFYVLLTLFILAIYSPRLHRVSNSIYIDDQKILHEQWEESGR